MDELSFELPGHLSRKELSNIRKYIERNMFFLKKIVLFAAVLACFFVFGKNAPNINLIDRQCLNQVVPEVGDAEHAINDVLDVLLNYTSVQGYYMEYDELVGDDHRWGNAACNGALTNGDCNKCLQISRDYIIQLCGFASGGHCKLQDCRLRYELYEFHGPW